MHAREGFLLILRIPETFPDDEYKIKTHRPADEIGRGGHLSHEEEVCLGYCVDGIVPVEFQSLIGESDGFSE